MVQKRVPPYLGSWYTAYLHGLSIKVWLFELETPAPRIIPTFAMLGCGPKKPKTALETYAKTLRNGSAVEEARFQASRVQGFWFWVLGFSRKIPVAQKNRPF